MMDPYLYPNSKVLRNLLNIEEESALDLAEAELSRANMMLLYAAGFSDFSSEGMKQIHKELFSDVYDWAGTFRVINIQKRESLLGGRSVWYSNDDTIETDLQIAWDTIAKIDWDALSQPNFATQMAHTFPVLWQIHPFREGNTRTLVMLMTFFTEHYGFYFDQELISSSAGYVRDSFVMASIGEHAEYQHLEKILLDAICTHPIELSDDVAAEDSTATERYQKYHRENYKYHSHEYRDSDEDTEK